ncbi:MAG TPA: cell division protein FtsL [bacterium]|nr:cell division protein FtsL [bacterium]
MQTTGTIDIGMRKAGEILDAGLFWRGNLAKAVKRRDFKGTLWGVMALSFLLFFYVWQHMQVVKLGYEVQELKMEKQQLTNQYYYLKYRMYDVNSLSRVEKVAREQLGMVTPRTDQIVILDDDSLFTPKWFSLWTNTMKKTEKN